MPDPLLPDLIRLEEALRATLDRAARDEGIGTSEYLVLRALEGGERLSGAQLARVARVTPQSMHGVLVRLQRDALLEPHAHPTDGRLRVFALTKAGGSAAAEARRRAESVEARLTSALDANGVEEVGAAVSACVAALERLIPRAEDSPIDAV